MIWAKYNLNTRFDIFTFDSLYDETRTKGGNASLEIILLSNSLLNGT